MGVTVNWNDETKSALHFKYSGKWTWEDYAEATTHGYELVHSMEHHPDVIADFSGTSMIPTHALTFPRSSFKQRQNSYGTVVIVSQSSLLDALLSIFRKVNADLGKKMYVVKSLDEAHELLAKIHSGVHK
jgi:hypothetical protein